LALPIIGNAYIVAVIRSRDRKHRERDSPKPRPCGLGDPVMALILGALLIEGIQPGPQLISEHADIFWGLKASFWIRDVLLALLNCR
jgi:hypothetical protein